MQKSRIFLIGADASRLFPMEECAYDAEHVLQEHLVSTPDLLPGDQIDQDNPRRWLLVKREAGIPNEKDGSDFWSIDHLFVDQDGVPTLVECKRSCDPRLRRVVVAQMLDYAANGMAYWPKGKMRLLAEETAIASGRLPAQAMGELLQTGGMLPDNEQDDFWETVDNNLSQGILRLLFVADAIPKELRRIIEFLNSKLSDIEVLGVELKQFSNADHSYKAFAPRIIGHIERVQNNKSAKKKKFSSITEQLNIFPNKDIFEKLIEIAQNRKHITDTGKSSIPFRCIYNDKQYTYALCKPTGSLLQFTTEYMQDEPGLTNVLETTLRNNGYHNTGKLCFNIPVNSNTTQPIDILTQIIDALDAYTATSTYRTKE